MRPFLLHLRLKHFCRIFPLSPHSLCRYLSCDVLLTKPPEILTTKLPKRGPSSRPLPTLMKPTHLSLWRRNQYLDRAHLFGKPDRTLYNPFELIIIPLWLYRCECIICADRISSLRSFHAPCGHSYCRSCIVDLAEASTHDESLFPLRCCKRNHFDLDDVAPFLTSDLLALVRKKAVEFGTPPGNRVYCANPNCSAFLGPSDDLQTDIVCIQCNTTVCSSCKNTAHPNEACAENTAILEVRALALVEHWQTCPAVMILLSWARGTSISPVNVVQASVISVSRYGKLAPVVSGMTIGLNMQPSNESSTNLASMLCMLHQTYSRKEFSRG